MAELLNEVNNGLTPNTDDKVNEPQINFTGEMTLVEKAGLGDVILVSGKLSASFYTQCGLSGEVFLDKLKVKLNAAFINESYQDREEYSDMIDIEVSGKVYDLFYTKQKNINLMDLFREFIYINKNPYPAKK